jgi:hypothetical protein
MRLLGLLALISIAAPFTAQAGGCGGSHDSVDVVQHIFDEADLDGDGLLSHSEYEGSGLQGFGVTFEESDLNSDGGTSSDEYRELYERHHPTPNHSETEA